LTETTQNLKNCGKRVKQVREVCEAACPTCS
jgi:hypothetical protein